MSFVRCRIWRKMSISDSSAASPRAFEPNILISINSYFEATACLNSLTICVMRGVIFSSPFLSVARVCQYITAYSHIPSCMDTKPDFLYDVNNQGAEVRDLKSEVRGQRSGGRNQRPGIRYGFHAPILNIKSMR